MRRGIMPEPEMTPPPLSKEERLELEAFKSDLKTELSDMNDAAVRHVERIVAPFAALRESAESMNGRVTQLEKHAEMQSQRMATLETHTTAQTTILKGLEKESVKNKKDRIARREERVERKALDEQWRKNRRWITFALGLFVAAAEIYHNCHGG
jgi:hypothetical protein